MSETESPTIPCSGPCLKRFRPDNTAVISERVADILLTIDDPAESGLAWFCPDCRRTMTPDVRLLQDPLPPELWLLIFQHLTERSMLSVRLTCCRWRAIVDGHRCMRDKLCAYFWEVTLDRHCAPENLIRTSQVQLYDCKIYGIGTWWSWYGAGLTVLNLSRCEIKLAVFLGMLRETVNLVEIILDEMDYLETDEKTAVDFQLEKLEALNCDKMFDGYGQMFPRLTKLSIPGKLYGKQVEIACQMLQTAQDTLKDLTCGFTPHMLQQIAGMSRLRLMTVNNLSDDLDTVLKLSQIQPEIEDLSAAATSRVILGVALTLTRLRKASVRIKHEHYPPFFIPAFLGKAPSVTSMTLSGPQDKYPVNFGIVTAPHLRYVHLSLVTLNSPTLRNFLSSCTNLQELKLHFCALNSWLDIFTADFQSLRLLDLHQTNALYEDVDDQDLTRLTANPATTLDIYQCNVSTKLLLQLIPNRFSQLRKLSLSVMESVDDEVIQGCRQLPLLDELLVWSCSNLTDASVETILACGTLRTLNVWACKGVSEEVMRKVDAFQEAQ